MKLVHAIRRHLEGKGPDMSKARKKGYVLSHIIKDVRKVTGLDVPMLMDMAEKIVSMYPGIYERYCNEAFDNESLRILPESYRLRIIVESVNDQRFFFDVNTAIAEEDKEIVQYREFIAKQGVSTEVLCTQAR
jgi:hypothetical protein